MASPLTLEVNNLYPRLTYSSETIDRFFEEIFTLHHHGCSGSLSIAFLDRSSHSQVHGNFLKDFRPTDVITFPADPDEGIAGEICVSVDQAIEESGVRGIPFARELSLYLVHGWLHLVGFDDRIDEDRKIMRREESKVLGLIENLELWPDFLLAPSSGDQ
ncbi:rRNA maturation RNase YbeY [Verrucomicrobia bacterium]|nr:rRNA maturation RNase YbeY [Verrucomicrobiota bacterium]